ncbi:MAG: hypothetical protein ACJAS1_003632 [Oleiphilaceae bacterium]|jgi:hypothetical protein
MRILHSRKLIFISKPRCGSTSVRRFLDSMMQPGDEYSDYGYENPALHPHMSGPAVHAYLQKKGIYFTDYQTFTITRNPIDMLWSYFNYFKPDINSNYYYSPIYDKDNLSNFEHWIECGRVGIGEWRIYCPSYINDTNFSPLSLEAHNIDKEGRKHIDKIFTLEGIDECAEWLSGIFNCDVNIDAINTSNSANRPLVSSDALVRIINDFPAESELYKISL